MTDHRSPAARLAATRAATPRPAVDHNGRPTGPPAVYRYDEAGRLVGVDTPEPPS